MYPQLKKFETAMKQSKHHLTGPRKTVFSALLENDTLSMAELVRACPEFDRASIYRTVQLLEELGIIHRLQMGWKYQWELSDDYHDHHHHMSCDRCGRVFRLSGNKVLENKLREATATLGFQMRNHQLEVQGLCDRCQPKIKT
jgi:Fur family ferric uptake transcriptional regulator